MGLGDTRPRGRNVCLRGGGAVKQKEEGKTQLFIGEGKEATNNNRKSNCLRNLLEAGGDGPIPLKLHDYPNPPLEVRVQSLMGKRKHELRNQQSQ